GMKEPSSARSAQRSGARRWIGTMHVTESVCCERARRRQEAPLPWQFPGTEPDPRYLGPPFQGIPLSKRVPPRGLRPPIELLSHHSTSGNRCDQQVVIC